MAPRLIRLPLYSEYIHEADSKQHGKGITEATIRPALKLPRSSTNTKMTISAPSARFLITVLMALSTRFCPVRNASMHPRLQAVSFSIWAMRSFTLAMTSEQLAPFSISTIAPTTSPSLFLVMAPYLVAAPISLQQHYGSIPVYCSDWSVRQYFQCPLYP